MHGDYNYHNILILPGDTAITNFEHMRIGIQVQDLYYFLRKAMEKYRWKQKLGLGSSGRMKDNAGWSRENGSIWGFSLPILRSSGRLPAVIAGRIRHGCLKKCGEAGTCGESGRRKDEFSENYFRDTPVI